MISVITCLKKYNPDSIHERNVAKTVGTEHEYLAIDISSGIGIAGGYNFGVSIAKGDICVFIPEDVFFMKMNWGKVLEAKFSNASIGMVGVVGTQYLFADRYSITAAGKPFIKGRFVQHLENGDFFAIVFSNESGDFEVVACDGVFMAMPKLIFNYVRFDEATFTGPYFHDLDISMQIRQGAKMIVTSDIVIKRRSQLQFDKIWHYYGQLFLQKYAQYLPAFCTNQIPNPQNSKSSSIVDLKGKAPMETIC